MQMNNILIMISLRRLNSAICIKIYICTYIVCIFTCIPYEPIKQYIKQTVLLFKENIQLFNKNNLSSFLFRLVRHVLHFICAYHAPSNLCRSAYVWMRVCLSFLFLFFSHITPRTKSEKFIVHFIFTHHDQVRWVLQ